MKRQRGMIWLPIWDVAGPLAALSLPLLLTLLFVVH
jgi:hypothetical protein